MSGTPAADVAIGTDLARHLLERQHPDLSRRSIRLAGEGWDNAMFRLGDDLALRMPRRDSAALLIEHEQRWLPGLQAGLPLEIPAPVRVGAPDLGYPHAWSVVPWFEGQTADIDGLGEGDAERFGAFLAALHRPAPDAAPRNPVRGVPLEVRREALEERMDRVAVGTSLVDDAIRRLWSEALEAPDDAPETWIHGDLHARNVLVHAGRLRAVIDWGDVAKGDAATDLAALWMLFDSPAARAVALERRGPVSEATLARARGWAVFFGVVLLDTGLVDHPAHARMGERTLRRLSEEASARQTTGAPAARRFKPG